MSNYNVKDNALIDSNIEENYNYLFNEVNNTKTRFIKDHLNGS